MPPRRTSRRNVYQEYEDDVYEPLPPYTSRPASVASRNLPSYTPGAPPVARFTPNVRPTAPAVRWQHVDPTMPHGEPYYNYGDGEQQRFPAIWNSFYDDVRTRRPPERYETESAIPNLVHARTSPSQATHRTPLVPCPPHRSERERNASAARSINRHIADLYRRGQISEMYPMEGSSMDATLANRGSSRQRSSGTGDLLSQVGDCVAAEILRSLTVQEAERRQASIDPGSDIDLDDSSPQVPQRAFTTGQVYDPQPRPFRQALGDRGRAIGRNLIRVFNGRVERPNPQAEWALTGQHARPSRSPPLGRAARQEAAEANYYNATARRRSNPTSRRRSPRNSNTTRAQRALDRQENF